MAPFAAAAAAAVSTSPAGPRRLLSITVTTDVMSPLIFFPFPGGFAAHFKDAVPLTVTLLPLLLLLLQQAGMCLSMHYIIHYEV